jgi:hypothetical protein
LSVKLRLLSILPKLMKIGMQKFEDLIREFPEARSRSALLVLYDDRGNKLALWIGFEGDEPRVREVDLKNPPPATNEISTHVDTFIKILKGRLDFRTAYLYDLVDIKSNDGLPASYHLLIWSAFFDEVVKLLK